VEDSTRIPNSAARRGLASYAKLLTRVDARAQNGFGFEGTFVRPGKIVPIASLWPTSAHPPTPLLLEYAGQVAPQRGHRRAETRDLYVLWKFDVLTRRWEEVARTTASNWEWALDLRPIAIRILQQSRGTHEVELYDTLERAVTRVGRVLDLVMLRLPERERAQFVGVLHDLFSVRISQLSA
jgi:hypothetical protein